MRSKVLLILMNICSGLLFFFINQMTPHPSQTSGNGNPAIPLIILLFFLFCYLAFLWLKTFNNIIIKRLHLILVMLIITIFWIIGVLYQKAAFIVRRDVLAEAYKVKHGSTDWEYINQITSSILSIHVNNHYFNVVTYFIFISAPLLIAIIFKFIKDFTSHSKESF